jgi:exopolyphosphatase/guanosine-5'-triphosphate,3'-diphosphate pyrophosphatase
VTRVAALDCGTNSLRLLIADLPSGGGPLVDVVRRTEIVRLGQGVDRTGELAAEALARTATVLEVYAGLIREHGVEASRVRLVATSATRDARNRQDFVDMVESSLGVTPEVVSGEEEAGLSFAGATRELAGDVATPAPYLVVDAGGGSTELVVGDADGVHAAYSMDVGCVRLTERHLRDDPPTDAEAAEVEADVEAALRDATGVVPVAEAATVVAVAGTATTVTALALGLPEYDSAVIHHATVTYEQLDVVTERLRHSSSADIRAMPVVHPKRADVLTAGALVLRTVFREIRAARYVASEHDILDGIAWSIGARRDGGIQDIEERPS